MNINVETLPPVVAGAEAATYDEVRTCYSMYVPAEAVTQGEQDALGPLIDWLRVAVTRTAADDTTTSLVACTLPPTIPVMDSEFAEKQRVMAGRDLPAWSLANAAAGSNTAPPAHHGNPAQAAILQSLQILLLQVQTTQGTVAAPAHCTKKPSEHWEGTIDLLLRLVGVTAESDLPPLWHAWSNCNKKESRTVLQEHLCDNARALGLPEPVASGDLTTMLNTMAFDFMYEDDLEAGL
jgi:hypothetical protein